MLLVCTPNFSQKADAGVGGVGYEKAIVTGEIFAGEARETKFVPLLREGDGKESLPSYLKSRLFVDFRDDAVFENRLEELLRHFYGEPIYRKPPIGSRPKFIITPSSVALLQKPVLQQKITNSIGMEFVLIPAGFFTMGSRLSPKEIVKRYGGEEEWYKLEKPRHSLKIEQPYYLQTTPVTQGQWQRVMGDNPSCFTDCGDNCPVESVSWEDAQQFIEKLNQVEKTKAYRLPSEAEWEYACRAGSETEFYFGDDAERLGEFAWFDDNSERKPIRWGRKSLTLGVYTTCMAMSGSGLRTTMHVSYKGAPDDGNAWVGSPRGPHRVVRGGSYDSDAQFCRSAMRSPVRPGTLDGGVGFRLSRSVAIGS